MYPPAPTLGAANPIGIVPNSTVWSSEQAARAICPIRGAPPSEGRSQDAALRRSFLIPISTAIQWISNPGPTNPHGQKPHATKGFLCVGEPTAGEIDPRWRLKAWGV